MGGVAMLTFERYDFRQEYDLTPLISAFVSAHDDILNSLSFIT